MRICLLGFKEVNLGTIRREQCCDSYKDGSAVLICRRSYLGGLCHAWAFCTTFPGRALGFGDFESPDVCIFHYQTKGVLKACSPTLFSTLQIVEFLNKGMLAFHSFSPEGAQGHKPWPFCTVLGMAWTPGLPLPGLWHMASF